MKRETYINGNKTIIDTDFYLELLNKEQENSQLKERIEKAIKKLTSEITDAEMGNCEEIHISCIKNTLKILKGDKE